MPRDLFIKRNQCRYCGRTGVTAWDSDLLSCRHEICESLAFAEVRRRSRNGGLAPEKRLARALLAALDTFEYELRLDRDAELISEKDARAIDEVERERTAHLLAELHELERRYPAAQPGLHRSRPRRPKRLARERKWRFVTR